MRRLVIGEEDIDAVLHKEAAQRSLVLRLAAAVGETRPQFAEYDERHNDGFGLFQESHGLDDTFAEIDVSIGVESDPHSQRSSSTRSCAAIAVSKALSAFHVPATSPRSLRFRGASIRPVPSVSASIAASL